MAGELCEEEDFPAWSPDGSLIAYNRGGDVYVIRADGSGKRRIGPGLMHEWSPDGRTLIFADGTDATRQIYAAADQRPATAADPWRGQPVAGVVGGRGPDRVQRGIGHGVCLLLDAIREHTGKAE